MFCVYNEQRFLRWWRKKKTYKNKGIFNELLCVRDTKRESSEKIRFRTINLNRSSRYCSRAILRMHIAYMRSAPKKFACECNTYYPCNLSKSAVEPTNHRMSRIHEFFSNHTFSQSNQTLWRWKFTHLRGSIRNFIARDYYCLISLSVCRF